MSPQHEPSLLTPPRDTGLMLEGRIAREQRLRKRQQQRLLLTAASVTAALIASGWLLSRNAPTRAADTSTTIPGATRVSAMELPQPDPTPLFAAYRDIGLHLPVPADKLTEVAFHQASYSYAQHLVTRLPTVPMEAAKNKRGTGRTSATSIANEQGWLGGSVLRLWRNRPGRPDSAADVGAPAGSPVLAPVTGEVLLVRAYKLYGKYPDFQIHIRPSGHDDLDAVLIHVTDPLVARGDQVLGGVTQVGSVRNLSSKMRLQLTEYVSGAGDHTHVQLNRVKPGTTEPVTKS